jgi:UTP--glucose-1-phosphate uridylyltransferase
VGRISKAVVAVAGSGTRFLPVTKAIPKEMLPIVDRPIIEVVVEELVDAGIEDIIMVTRWDKKPLEDHFDNNSAWTHELRQAGKHEDLERVRKISDRANFIYVRQKGPYGNGTPVLTAASLLGTEPFVYVWGDDLVKSRVSFTRQMIEDYHVHGHMVIGVQEVPKEMVCRYGIVKLRPDTMQIEDIIEKPSVDQAPSQLADFGRMILDAEMIDILRKTPTGKGNELWIVDGIRRYVLNGGIFFAKEVEDGEWLTTGDPLNYLKAVLKYALDREDINQDLRTYIQQLMRQEDNCRGSHHVR